MDVLKAREDPEALKVAKVIEFPDVLKRQESLKVAEVLDVAIAPTSMKPRSPEITASPRGTERS